MIKKYKIISKFLINNISFPLIFLMVFCFPFGDLLSTSFLFSGSLKVNFTAIFGVLLIIVGVISGLFINGIVRYPPIIFFITVIFIISCSSFINSTVIEPHEVSKTSLYLIYLSSIFTVIMGMKITKAKFISILICFLSSLVLSTIISIFDFTKIIEVEILNSDISYVRLFGVDVPCMTSFFSTRTAYAIYLSFGMSVLIYLLLINKISFIKKYKISSRFLGVEININILNKFFYLIPIMFSLIILLIASGFNHSRTLMLTVVSCLLVGAILNNYTRKYILYFIGFIITLLFLKVIATGDSFFDFNYDRYLRLNATVYSILSIPNNPLGTGFPLVLDSYYGFINPHNSILYILVSGGFWAMIIFILYFTLFIKTYFRIAFMDDDKFIILLLISWMVFNFFHTVITASFGWILFGIICSYFMSKQEKLDESKV